MPDTSQRNLESVAIPLAVALNAAVLAVGVTRGISIVNLHNLGMGLAATLVGAHVLARRPRHRVGVLLIAVGTIESLLFFARQVGLNSSSRADAWLGWLGVWPTALAIASTTLLVLVFPEGRFLSRRWAVIGGAVVVIAGCCSLMSLLWPVEYAYMSIASPFPFDLPGRSAVEPVWGAIAHPAYSAMLLLWLVVIVARWRVSDDIVRLQLKLLIGTVACILVILFADLAITGRPWLGLAFVSAVPLVMGWCIERLSLGRIVETERSGGRLQGLTPREQEVLELMAEGLSNTAIAARLNLSLKTVEPAIGSIFRKLGLDDGTTNNRRVQAVVAYWTRAG